MEKVRLKMFFFLFFILFYFGVISFAEEGSLKKEYDGVWFMGFNLHKDIFLGENGKKVRKAFNLAIDRGYITKNIIGDSVVPTGVIPPGMLGYDPNLKGYDYNLPLAKKLMVEAGYPTSDKRLKTLTMLHTDGEKTIEIAKWIKRYLIGLGVDLSLKQVSYANTLEWEKELKSGKYHLFLMGYKASTFGSIFVGNKMTKIFHTITCENFPSPENQVFFGSFEEAKAAGYTPCKECKPEEEPVSDTVELLKPLFYTDGKANFMFYSNPKVDKLFDELEEIDTTLSSIREPKLKKINEIILDDAPAVNLFYITKL